MKVVWERGSLIFKIVVGDVGLFHLCRKRDHLGFNAERIQDGLRARRVETKEASPLLDGSGDWRFYFHVDRHVVWSTGRPGPKGIADEYDRLMQALEVDCPRVKIM